MIVFLNKGKNGVKNYNLFHSVRFPNNGIEILFPSSVEYSNSGMETLFYSVPLHSTPFYFVPIHSVRFKISKHSLRVSLARVGLTRLLR